MIKNTNMEVPELWENGFGIGLLNLLNNFGEFCNAQNNSCNEYLIYFRSITNVSFESIFNSLLYPRAYIWGLHNP